MDPLSIAGSSVAFGLQAINACRILMDLIAAIDNAPIEVEHLQRIVQSVYEDIETLRCELQQRNIQEAVEINQNLRLAVKSLGEPIKICTQNLEDICSKLQAHRPTPYAQSKFRSGLKWWWAKKGFHHLTTRLEGNKEIIKNKIQMMIWICVCHTMNPNAESKQVQQAATDTNIVSALRNYTASIYSDADTVTPSIGQLFALHPELECQTKELEPISREQIPFGVESRLDLLRHKRELQQELLAAAQEGDCEKAEILLEGGTGIAWSGEDGHTALHLAARYGRESVVQLLLDRGADTEIKSAKTDDSWDIKFRCGRTPLHWAAAGFNTGASHKAVVKLLLENGADVAAKNSSLRTPLQDSIKHCDESYDPIGVAELLLDNGAPVSAQDDAGWSPIHEAACSSNVDIVRVILDRRQPGDLEARTLAGETPLLLTGRKWSQRVIAHFLDCGANVEAENWIGKSLLGLAMQEGKINIVHLLLRFTQDINKRCRASGCTALHVAASQGNIDIVRAILTKGGNVMGRCKRNLIASDHARANGHNEVAYVLDEANLQQRLSGAKIVEDM